MKYKNLLKIRYRGLNWIRFQNDVLNQGIVFAKIEKHSYDDITFMLSKKDYDLIIKDKKYSGYKLHIEEHYGFHKLKYNFFNRLGAYIGIILMLVGVVSVSRLTLNYNIYGLNTIKKDEVVQLIEDFGIKKGKLNNFDNSELERYLLSNLSSASMVSVMTKGNSICVNIKEKTSQIATDYIDITSPYNMIIKSINVVSGTPLYKEGDVVTVGKTLIGAYTLVGDKKVPCAAIGSITGEAWWIGNVEFEKEVEELSRTGNKTTNIEILLGNKVIYSKQNDVGFNVYEVVEKSSNVTDNFLPLVINRDVYYECTSKKVTQNLDESKEILLHESRLLAYNKVPLNIKIDSEEQKIIELEDKYLVQTYLKKEVEILGEN